jgi:hypothetical protein
VQAVSDAAPGVDQRRARAVAAAADGQPVNGVRGGVPGSKEDNGYVIGPRAQSPAHLEAVNVGEQHVARDEVAVVGVGQIERVIPGRAVVTAKPWKLSATWTSSRIFGSSSTMSTFGFWTPSAIVLFAANGSWTGSGVHSAPFSRSDVRELDTA